MVGVVVAAQTEITKTANHDDGARDFVKAVIGSRNGNTSSFNMMLSVGENN